MFLRDPGKVLNEYNSRTGVAGAGLVKWGLALVSIPHCLDEIQYVFIFEIMQF
jgi:hypothetical protein